MSESFINWPGNILPPAEVVANLTPFTRSGGRSLGGIERTTRTDKGFWNITLDQVPVHSPAQHRVWNSIRTQLGGRQGLIMVPVWSFKSAPYVSAAYEELVESSHDDGTSFDDGTLYRQGSIDIEMATYAALGSTVITLRATHASTVSGINFSYQGALYQTGPILQQTALDLFRVSVFPSIRMAIPSGAALEVNEPMCLCRLADDRGMDISEGITPLVRKTVNFVEAVDIWSDLALGLIAFDSPYYPPFPTPYNFDPSLDFSQAGNSQYITL